MTDEEALFVLIRVDEPAGDAVGAVAADLTGRGIKDVHAEDLDLDIAILGVQDLDTRFTENNERRIVLGGMVQ